MKFPSPTSAIVGVDAELSECRRRHLKIRRKVQRVIDDLELRIDEVDREAGDAGRDAQRDALLQHVVGGLNRPLNS